MTESIDPRRRAAALTPEDDPFRPFRPSDLAHALATGARSERSAALAEEGLAVARQAADALPHPRDAKDGPRSPFASVIDRVVPSYAPTLAAPTHSRRPGATPSARGGRTGGALVVAVPESGGAAPLPQARREARAVGETLSAARVQEIPLERGALAFLSACSTAVAVPDLPDEPMHLAAAFQLAGFRDVTGTLWRSPDTPRMAGAIYRVLTADGARLPDTAACARALNDAQLAVRDAFPATPTRWAAYVHTGA